MQQPPDSTSRALRIRIRRLLTVLAGFLFVRGANGAVDFGETLLGTWGGARSALLREGIHLEARYTGERAANLSGGESRGSLYQDLGELKLTLKGSQLLGWTGMTGYIHAFRAHGSDPASLAGDAQGLSNISAGDNTRLQEAWVQQNFHAHGLSLLAGRYDLNSEFYQLQSAGVFLNSSFGIGPELSLTGTGGPSLYPDTAVGARIALWPTSSAVLRGAVLNGVPVNVPRADGAKGIRRSGDGLFLIGEAAVVWPRANAASASNGAPSSPRQHLGREAGNAEREGKLAVGAWRYTAQFDSLSQTDASGAPVRERANGFYGIAEQVVYRDVRRPGRRVTAFVQCGLGDQDVFRFGRYVGVGATFSGYVPGRAGDEFGIAIASARNGSPYLASERRQGRAADAAETAIEATYLAKLAPWLSLQPSVQYIVHPGTVPSRNNATAALLRFEVTL